MSQDPIIITGKDNMRKFHVLQVIHGLALEISTGMKLSRGGSLIKVAKQCGYTQKQTKVGALLDCVQLMTTLDPEYVVSERVSKALGQ